jgi:thioredoxin 1
MNIPLRGIITGGNNMIKEVSDKSFEAEITNSDSIVVVDFWAPWCGPCKMLTPVMEELAKEMGDKVKFAKVNVDDNPLISSKYRVASIPTVMVFSKDTVKDTMVGFRPKADLKKIIERHL